MQFHRAVIAAALGAAAAFALTHAAPARADGFTLTGSLAIDGEGRYGAGDVLLPDGRVLIAGGFDSSARVASAVIWNPATGTFSVTPNGLSFARAFPTVNMLGTNAPGVKILFADGGDGTDDVGSYANADIFDTSTGMFTATQSTHDPRHNSTGTLLANGKVLIAGGITNDVAKTRLATAELYDPAGGTFAYTGSMHAARDFHAAVRLPNGNVLVAGGGDGSGLSLDTAETYDPGTGTWTLLANHMVEPRDDATATLLPNNKVLIFGGVNADVPTGTAELFDYTNNTFTAVPTSITPRHYHTATLLNNGKVLIVGGINHETDTSKTLNDAQLYDPVTNSFSPAGTLNVGRFYHTATKLSDGRVLVAGGYTASGVTATAEVYGALGDPIFENGFE